MTRRLQGRLTAVGLCLLLVAGGTTLWSSLRPADGIPTRHDAAGLATSTRIVIRRPGRPALVLERDPPAIGAALPDGGRVGRHAPAPQAGASGEARQADWQIVAPHRLPANARRIAPLLALLDDTAAGYARDEIDAQAAGLASPPASLEIDGRRFDIGGLDHTGTRRYLRSGDTIRLVDEWLLSLVEGGVGAFADLAVFPDGLERLRLADESDRELLVADWRELAARQIVDWPRGDADPPRARYHLAATGAGDTRRYVLELRSGYAALAPEGGGFAYILERDTIPDLDDVR